MAWILLVIAGLLEVVWAIGLKYTKGFTELWPSVVTIIAMALSMILLAWALPQTRGWAGLWVRALVLTLILQPVQVLILGIAVGTLAPLGAGRDAELLAPLVGLATLHLLIKAPELLGGPVAGPTSLSRAVALPLRLARLARGRR